MRTLTLDIISSVGVRPAATHWAGKGDVFVIPVPVHPSYVRAFFCAARSREFTSFAVGKFNATNPNLNKSFTEFLLSGVYDNLLRGDVQ